MWKKLSVPSIIVAVALSLGAVGANATTADEAASANQLLVEALANMSAAENADTNSRALDLYSQAIARIERIVREFPRSDLAVRIISGQAVGDFRLTNLKALQQSAYAAELREQNALLRTQLGQVAQALEVAEAKTSEQEEIIADLGRRLNLALASRVEDMAKYRSEFFGRMREVLGERRHFRVVGDRFVLQSALVFEAALADLSETGKRRVSELSDVLKAVTAQIPPDIPWIIQVDGHADKREILEVEGLSDWELSTARAISVAKLLTENGIPADRLSVAGYGAHQPMEAGNDQLPLQQNRRVELRLTQR